MKSIAKSTLFDIKPYVPGKPIAEAQRELGLKKIIKLASNENPYGPSPKVLKAIGQAAESVNRYPDGDCFYLRKKLSRKLKVDPKKLIFGNGSDEVIVMAVRVFVNGGDEVVIAKPSFLIYDMASRIAGAKIKSIPLKGFRYDLKGMKEAVTAKTKIIFLGNPDNPSGSYFTRADIENFFDGLRDDILVFMDEAYYEYVDAKDYVDSVDLLKNYKNLLITRTFSKMYGLAGLRIGYGIANQEVIDFLNRIREPFNVNALAQVAAGACLDDSAYYRRIAARIRQQRNYLYRAFQKINLPFVESCANFILLRFNGRAGHVAQKLLKKGIIVRDMSAWGLTDYIRMTIGTEKENARFIRVLEEIA